MKGLIVLLIAILLLAACGSNNRVPAGIIPSQQMETIIWQIMQADQYVATVLAKDSTKKSNAEKSKIYQKVFELNKTSKEAFQESYQFYMAHPEITKIIFDSITAKAARQRTDLYQIKPDTIAKRPGSMATDTALKHQALLPVNINTIAAKQQLMHAADSAMKARKIKIRAVHTAKKHRKRK